MKHMWKKILLALALLPIFFIGIPSIYTQTHADHIPQCNPADIKRLEPTATDVISPHLCLSINPCWIKHKPAEINYDCYSVIVGVPPPPPPPPPRSGVVNFGLLEQALPGFNFTNKTLGDIIKEVVPYLFGIAGLILLLYLIWGGFSLMLSKGDQKAVEAARGRITTAITGFVIIFVAYWLVQILGLILGIEQFGQIFK